MALFGGIPATKAIARTATNIKNGAKTPVSGIIHSLVLLAFALFLSKAASAIPLAGLSAVLLVVAWDMSELPRFLGMRKAPYGDLAVFLFLRRTSETFSVSSIRELLESRDSDTPDDPEAMGPENILLDIDAALAREAEILAYRKADREEKAAAAEARREPYGPKGIRLPK